jgi:hypothetical protein
LILQTAWPALYGKATGGYAPYQELTASLNAYISGGFSYSGPYLTTAGVQNGGAYLHLFACAGQLVYSLAYSGTASGLCTK